MVLRVYKKIKIKVIERVKKRQFSERVKSSRGKPREMMDEINLVNKVLW